tara:strand:+ start:5813 stop:6232 length:420 start_codon:yes stop_codon:yes gene_type:complete
MATNRRTTFDYLEGSLQYPYIFDTKDRYDHYSVAVLLTGDQIAKAKKLGLKLKQDPEKNNGMPYVQLRSNYKPDLFNGDGEPYDGPTMISNGSTGVVKITQRPYDNQYGKGLSTFFTAVKLLDVIEYTPDSEGQGASEF